MSHARATYTGGSGTRVLRFAYPVGEADDGAENVVVVAGRVLLRGATIRTLEGGAAAETYDWTAVVSAQVALDRAGRDGADGAGAGAGRRGGRGRGDAGAAADAGVGGADRRRRGGRHEAAYERAWAERLQPALDLSLEATRRDLAAAAAQHTLALTASLRR